MDAKEKLNWWMLGTNLMHVKISSFKFMIMLMKEKINNHESLVLIFRIRNIIWMRNDKLEVKFLFAGFVRTNVCGGMNLNAQDIYLY